MIVIMVVALFVAHILKNPRSVEGAENMNNEDEEDEKKPEDEEKPEDENYENKEETEEPDEEKIKEELKEFATVQKDIIDNMTKLEPLLNKADSFIEKFEKYSKSE
jgi:flagellar biosynthesis/type III secretory pathway M-ring protein FliF/YscJ